MSKAITVKIHSIHSVPQATCRFGTKLSNSQCKGGKLTNYRIHDEKQSHGLVDSRTGHCAVRWCPQQCHLMWTHSTPVSVHFSWTQKHCPRAESCLQVHPCWLRWVGSSLARLISQNSLSLWTAGRAFRVGIITWTHRPSFLVKTSESYLGGWE